MVATSTDCGVSGCINVTVVPGVRAGTGMATQIRPSSIEVATPIGAPAAAICIAEMAATEINIVFIAVRLTLRFSRAAAKRRRRLQPLVGHLQSE